MKWGIPEAEKTSSQASCLELRYSLAPMVCLVSRSHTRRLVLATNSGAGKTHLVHVGRRRRVLDVQGEERLMLYDFRARSVVAASVNEYDMTVRMTFDDESIWTVCYYDFNHFLARATAYPPMPMLFFLSKMVNYRPEILLRRLKLPTRA